MSLLAQASSPSQTTVHGWPAAQLMTWAHTWVPAQCTRHPIPGGQFTGPRVGMVTVMVQVVRGASQPPVHSAGHGATVVSAAPSGTWTSSTSGAATPFAPSSPDAPSPPETDASPPDEVASARSASSAEGGVDPTDASSIPPARRPCSGSPQAETLASTASADACGKRLLTIEE
jgi:hypothetical protein